MPTYESKCSVCDAIHTYKRSIRDRDDTPVCCGETTVRGVFSAPSGFLDIPSAGPKRVWGVPEWKRNEDAKRN